MAVSRECLQRCLETLLAKRKEAEEVVAELASAPLPRRADYDEGIGYEEARGLAEASRNTAFHNLRKINLRIEVYKSGYRGACPSCGKNLEESLLLENPMRELCVDCQKATNGKMR